MLPRWVSLQAERRALGPMGLEQSCEDYRLTFGRVQRNSSHHSSSSPHPHPRPGPTNGDDLGCQDLPGTQPQSQNTRVRDGPLSIPKTVS